MSAEYKKRKDGFFTSAVILAAGVGSRFGNENGTKQNVSVLGVPAVVRTVSAFEKCALIKEIILVGRREELSILEGYVKDHSLSKVTRVIEGGSVRMESSVKGVAAVSPGCTFVAVHDGARCLVTPEMIEDAVRAAFEYGCAASAQRVVDTVKLAGADGIITDTVDREKVWLVKTPQIFDIDIYRECAAAAVADGASVTDDCMMAERMGYKIKLCDCGQFNIKLTAREDLALAEFILSQREN